MTARGARARRVTLVDVAEHAGVSRATASLVLRGSALVADGTRERVLGSVQALGYVYNRGAASLRMQRTHTVGLVISGLANPFFADFIEGVEVELRPAGYVVLLANTFEDLGHQDTLVRTMLERQIDGLLVAPAVGSGREFVAPLDAVGVPYVLATRHVRGLDACFVGPDDRAGARMAVEHLLTHGAARFAYFGGAGEGSARTDRLAGMTEALAEAGLDLDPSWTVPSEVSSTDGYAVAREVMATSTPPDAVVCHSDAIAFGLMRALRESGVQVGTQCRVVGFDDVEHARAWSPGLTSVSVEARTMGRRTARMLVDRIDDPRLPNESLVLSPALAIRESCGCPASVVAG